jgi:predicted MFS family arabinose efflux permease
VTGAIADSPPATAKAEFRRYWPMLFAAAIGFSFHSVNTAFAGLYIGPVGEEFGWNRTQITAGLTTSSIISTLLSPFFGVLIDRWGTRKLALPGLVLKGGIYALFALMSASIVHWLAMWVIYAIVSCMVKSTVWTTAVAGVFDSGRGLALGIVMSGTALAQIVVPPLGHVLIEEFGWRGAFVWMGLGWGGLALILCAFFLYDAHDHAKARAKATGEAATRVVLPGLTIPQAWREPALWRLAISTFLMMVFTIALVVHQIPILVEAGISRGEAALLASLGGAAGIAGKLVTGWLMDRMNAILIGALTIGGASLGFGLLLEPIRTPALIVVAIVINGYASGTKLQICSFLTARYAGMRNFGTIFGIMAALIALGSGLGPVLGGIAYDLQGNYTLLLIGGMVGSIVSAFLIAGLGPQPDWTTGEKAPA